MRKIGVNLHAIPGLSDEAYVKTMAEVGFSAAFTGPRNYGEYAELFAKYGIAYETVHAPFKGINTIWLPGEEGEDMLKQLTDCVDGCAMASVPHMVVHLSSGLTPPPTTDIGRARFTELVNHAAKKKVRIAFENQRMLANLAWAMEEFGPETVGFCWDCGHENCFTPGREYMPLFGHRVECLHIHDNFKVFNEDKHLIPFDGAVDFNRVAEHLKQSGFAGTLMLEIITRNSQGFYEGLSADEYLQKAANAARKLAKLVDGE